MLFICFVNFKHWNIVINGNVECVTLVYRLSPLTTPPVEKSPIMNLTLQEILIIGNCNDQVLFEVEIIYKLIMCSQVLHIQ